MTGITHDDLVKRAARWLKNTCHCSVIATELCAYTQSRETPDAIGWVGGRSILVECKTSRADYYADLQKPARHGINGLGNWRFYLTPPGLLEGLSVPDGWGLYEVHGRSIRHAAGAAYANARPAPFSPCLASEMAILLSMLRRGSQKGKTL